MNNCVFVSIDDGNPRNDFPNPGNIIKRGGTEVGAVHHFIEKVVTSSKEDGASADAGAEAVDEDAVDMEENDVTIGGMDGKMLRNVVLNHFPLHDIRSTLACVNSKWRETALDATPSPDDYLTTIEEDRIPCAVEFLGQQKEKVSGLNSIETHGGVEYIKVFAGEGVIQKDHEDIWRMLSTSYTPLKWGEHFQSSQTNNSTREEKED